MKQIVILKLGGSLAAPCDIDVRYLARFRALIKKHARRGKRFVIIVGGGYTNRWYRDRAIEGGVRSARDLHWIGTFSTRLNAEFVRSMFGAVAHPKSYWDFSKTIRWRTPVLVVGGYKPGHSTDHDAVLMARKFGARRVINVTNVESLYTKDPKKFSDARPIKEISWKDYRRMFGNPRRHLPGQNVPIDAVAALASQKDTLATYYVGGADLKNLDNLLSDRPWRGTKIY